MYTYGSYSIVESSASPAKKCWGKMVRKNQVTGYKLKVHKNGSCALDTQQMNLEKKRLRPVASVIA
jgi:hypothetical protein